MKWETKKLREVCDVIKEKSKIGILPYIEIGDINIVKKNYFFKDKPSVKGAINAVRGDILISKVRPTRGAITVIGEKKAAVSNGFLILREKESIFKGYIFSLLRNNEEFFERLGFLSTGATYPTCKDKDILSYDIPVPSLREQKQIVKILDETFESLRKAKEIAEKNLLNAKELFESYLEEIFSNPGKDWEEKKLGEVCGKITQGPNPKMGKIIPEGNNFILKTKDFYNDRVLYDNCSQINSQLIEEWERFILIDKDIIIGLVGVGSIGKSNIFREQKNKKYIFTRATGLIRTDKEKLSPEYLLNYLHSPIGNEIIVKGIGGTTGQLVIKTSYFKDVKIKIPSLKEQKTIVSKLDALSKKIKDLETIYNKKVKNIEELKKAVLKKAFSGEITK